MNKRKGVGEKLSVLAKSVGLSQTALAEKLEIPSSQVNRFFRGHSDVYSSVLMDILKELGMDVDQMISKRLKSFDDVEHAEPKSKQEAVTFLFNELDELGKQTYLSQLLWAAKVTKGDAFPKHLEEQIKKEISLI